MQASSDAARSLRACAPGKLPRALLLEVEINPRARACHAGHCVLLRRAVANRAVDRFGHRASWKTRASEPRVPRARRRQAANQRSGSFTQKGLASGHADAVNTDGRFF